VTPTIAVLGLGAMGLPMARHLAQSFTIRSYDIDAARCRAAADFSACCGSAKETATGADIRPARGPQQGPWQWWQ